MTWNRASILEQTSHKVGFHKAISTYILGGPGAVIST